MQEEQVEYSPKQAALVLHVSDQTIYNWMAAGIIDPSKVRSERRGFRIWRYIAASEINRLQQELGMDEWLGNRLPALAAA
jgi:hypothetical protein